jgi:glucose/arabinose dehydrogenase
MHVVLYITLAACLLVSPIYGHALCLNGGGAFPGTLSYCSMYTGNVCCTSSDDSRINAAVTDLGVTGECLNIMKENLCAECDPWAIHLFGGENANANVAKVPFMCGSFCSQMYTACKDQVMNSNPYDSQRRDIALGDVFADVNAFCTAFSVEASDKYCFSGEPFVQPTPLSLNTSGSICIAKVMSGNDYLNLIQPDDRIFVASKGGVIKTINPSNYQTIETYLDISARVINNGEKGLLGLAFHPDFQQNGRFFVGYSCDPAKHDDCKWPCSRGCPWDGGCNDNTGQCARHDHMSVIAEYRAANGDPTASRADPVEVQRIFEYTQPYGNHNGGQLLFGGDNYLYLMFGDGGDGNDPQQNGQDKMNYLGKILRIDVNNKTNDKNYAVPQDNPFVGNSDYLPEIWALGMRNPWRCSFDKENPAYFFCGDVGQNNVEEVDLIVRGGNYGWRKWEGTRLNFPNDPEVPNHIDPIMEYNRAESGYPASVTGGYRYRGSETTCLEDHYVFADLYNKVFSSIENPVGSGIFQRGNVKVNCASDSPLTCSTTMNSIFSFGEDAAGELYFLTDGGVNKIVPISRCGLQCSEVATPNSNNIPSVVNEPSSVTTPTTNTNPITQSVPVGSRISSASRANTILNQLFGL